MGESNFKQSLDSLREGFLVTPPERLTWTSRGKYYVDGIAVSENVFDLVDAGELAAARAAWLAEWETKGQVIE